MSVYKGVYLLVHYILNVYKMFFERYYYTTVCFVFGDLQWITLYTSKRVRKHGGTQFAMTPVLYCHRLLD